MRTRVRRCKASRAEMRNVGQQREILLAAFDQKAYQFRHNAKLRPRLVVPRKRPGKNTPAHANHVGKMSPKEHCDRCRKWILVEAQKLDDEARQRVLRALEEKNEALCCMSIYQLRETGWVPASWDEVLTEWWDFAR